MAACYISPETEPLITRVYSFNFSVVLEVSIQCDFVITSLMKVTWAPAFQSVATVERMRFKRIARRRKSLINRMKVGAATKQRRFRGRQIAVKFSPVYSRLKMVSKMNLEYRYKDEWRIFSLLSPRRRTVLENVGNGILYYGCVWCVR